MDNRSPLRRVRSQTHAGTASQISNAGSPAARIELPCEYVNLPVVADSADEAACVPHLESAGYSLRFREPDWYEHRLFCNPIKTSVRVLALITRRFRRVSPVQD